MSRLSLIAAVARNGALGRDNALLWHLPEDLKFFRRMTQGCPVLMGRRTWDSLPPKFRPLPGRRNLVLTRQPGLSLEGAETATSLDDALARLGDADEVFVIGGAELYAQALPRADRLVLTEVHRAFDGDVHFPAWPREAFREVWREDHPQADPAGLGWSWVILERR